MPCGGEVAERAGGERGLADSRRSADQHERAGHEPSAEHAVELADAGRQAVDPGRLHLAESDGAQGAGTGASASGGAGTARGRRRPRLLRERVPLSAARTAAVPLGALVPALGAGVDGGGAGHAARLSGAQDGFAPGVLRSVRPGGFHRSFVHLLDQPVAGAEFLAVDTETNGLAGDLCELTEVGAVLVGGGELHETFDSVVRTERPLSRGIQRFTGITQAMVDAAPPPEEVLEELDELLTGRVLIAHSARFDSRVLRPGVRALRARLAKAAGPLHGPAGAPLRPPVAQALAGTARRLARHRRDRGPPGAARRAHLRAGLLRPVPAAVRERPHGRRRARPASHPAPSGQDRAGRAHPAVRAPGPLDAARRPGRLHLPRRARQAAVRRQVGVAALARAGPLLRARRAGPRRPPSPTTGPPTPSWARSCSRTG